MTNTTMNDTCELNDARELKEGELEFVSGGFGFWDAVGVAAGGLTMAAVSAYSAALKDTGI
jgi:hypothetical protein